MRFARVLTWLNLGGAAVSLVYLVVLLAATPPLYPCENDSGSTPANAGGSAAFCLLYGIVSFLISIGLAIGVSSEAKPWARRALLTALLLALVAGGAVFADAARWTCWE